MSMGGYDLWGYDPGVLRRYAEWIAASQGLNPDDATETVEFRRVQAVYASLLRAGSSTPLDRLPLDDGPPITVGGGVVLHAPRLMLVPHARVVPKRNEELAAIFDPKFEPSQEALLETAPVPAPTGSAPAGVVRLVAETTDSLTVEADLKAPAILLVTDAYSDGWRARSVLPNRGNAASTHYEVLPADYCLRGIPLSEGHHEIVLEYRPTAYVVGKWVSLASLLLYLAGLTAWCASRLPSRPNLDACNLPPEKRPLTALP